MKGKIKIMMGLVTILLMFPIHPQKSKAQNLRAFSEFMKFMKVWGVIGPMGAYLQGVLAYNDYLYDSKTVSSEDCVKVDESIGEIAKVMKKSLQKVVTDEELKKELLLAADKFVEATKLYAQYHKTGAVKFKNQADKKLEEAGKHWDNAGKIINNALGGAQ